MNKGKTVFSQVMDFIPRYAFDKCIQYHKGDHRIRTFTCWEQFLVMSFGQLCNRTGIRAIVTCLNAHKDKLYHMGFRSRVARSTIADANEKRPWKMYEDFAHVLIRQARTLYQDDPEFSLDIDTTVYAFDSTTIDLCLSVFDWADFRKKKAGIKLHTLLDIQGNIPTFISITNARENDVNALDSITLEAGAFYVMDRAYTSTERLDDINRAAAFFVVRAKTNIKTERIYSHPIDKSTGVRCDQTIRFSGALSRGGYPNNLRRVKYFDEVNQVHYVFWTNNFSLPALTIADLYKQRWQVELFFKWIKQNLRIKRFWGTSKNAVHTQVWIAVSAYLLVAIIKKKLNLDRSIYEILQILSVSLFDKTQLYSLLSISDLQNNDQSKNQSALPLHI